MSTPTMEDIGTSLSEENVASWRAWAELWRDPSPVHRWVIAAADSITALRSQLAEATRDRERRIQQRDYWIAEAGRNAELFAEATRDRDTWRTFAKHLQWCDGCAMCAETQGYCERGRELLEIANARGSTLGAPTTGQK
jgi:hypothetical protein